MFGFQLFLFQLKKINGVVGVVVNVGLWEKRQADSARIFPQIHIFFYYSKTLFRSRSKALAHFSLFRVVVGAGKKVFSRGWEDSGKVLAKSVGCGVFFKNEATESILHNLKL